MKLASSISLDYEFRRVKFIRLQAENQIMETDHQFYELFRSKPEWFETFTKIELPDGCVGKSINHKKIETRSDLVFAPAKKSDPHHVVEFQLYFDHSAFVRTGMSCQALWREINSPEDCRKNLTVLVTFAGSLFLAGKAIFPQR